MGVLVLSHTDVMSSGASTSFWCIFLSLSTGTHALHPSPFNDRLVGFSLQQDLSGPWGNLQEHQVLH